MAASCAEMGSMSLRACRAATAPAAAQRASISSTSFRTARRAGAVIRSERHVGQLHTRTSAVNARGSPFVHAGALGNVGSFHGNGRRMLGTFRASSSRRDEHVMNLPGLGDSISEGTIVQWCKSVGDEVAEDEVIAVVETDKVSVDVRSTHVGVIVKVFAAEDDVVEVGKPLCTVDGDEAAAVRAKIEAQEKEEDASAPPPEEKKPNLDDAFAGAFMAGADFVPPKKKRHEPLIQFLGKRSLIRQQEQEASKEPASPPRHRYSPGALDFSQIVGGAMFGRPTFSEAEIDAINSGGAEDAPDLQYIDGSRWSA